MKNLHVLKAVCCVRFQRICFEPTIPEIEGIIDRDNLLALNGRSRREQFKLAKAWGIEGFSPVGGGCLLTEKHFGARIKDMLEHGYRNLDDIVALKWGRYFRINKDCCAILGRDRNENECLISRAFPEDMIMRLKDMNGPAIVIKGRSIDEEVLSLCAGLVQRFSKARNEEPQAVSFWRAQDPEDGNEIMAKPVSEEVIESMLVEQE